MDSEVITLSRAAQFALTIMFHYLFPPLSIGLGVLMVLMEGTFLWTGKAVYHSMTRFWSRLFAVNFAMGVATGIVMEFQFGTNWAGYSRYVGDVFGSALAAEGIFAFFLESGFLSVLVFGWDRVSRGVHFFATLMVSLGSIFSSVWIMVANSWQHTPTGYEVRNGRAVITDFWAVVFSPSSVDRLVHVLLGAFILGGFFVLSISAYYVLRRKHLDFAHRSFLLSLVFSTLCTSAMWLSGHTQARRVARTQPAKLAAFEGHYETAPAGLYLIGIPDPESQTVRAGIAIPGMLSFLVHDDFNKPVVGLNHFREEDRPPVLIPFLTYHLMVGIGGGLLGLLVVALFFWWRGTLFEKRWLMGLFVVAVVGPYLANEAGWVATEVGRQPFLVYPKVEWQDDTNPVMQTQGPYPGLRTSQGISNPRVVEPGQVIFSISLFSVMYVLLFAVWVYVLNSKIQHGPDAEEPAQPTHTSGAGLFETAATLIASPDESLTRTEEPGSATTRTE